MLDDTGVRLCWIGAKIPPPYVQLSTYWAGSLRFGAPVKQMHVFYYEAWAGGVEEEHFRPKAGLRDYEIRNQDLLWWAGKSVLRSERQCSNNNRVFLDIPVYTWLTKFSFSSANLCTGCYQNCHPEGGVQARLETPAGLRRLPNSQAPCHIDVLNLDDNQNSH